MIKDSTNSRFEGYPVVPIPSVWDDRGGLSFAEAERHVPFSIRRVFWIYGVPDGAVRGGHAHWTCAELIVPVAGAFTMVIDDGRERREIRMDSPDNGILVEPGVWCELRDFAPGSVLVVMASQAYDATGYVHDYAQYIKELGRR